MNLRARDLCGQLVEAGERIRISQGRAVTKIRVDVIFRGVLQVSIAADPST